VKCLKFQSWRLFLLALFITSGIFLYFLSQSNETIEQSYLYYRELWNARDVHDYSMIVDTLSLPIPPIGVELTIQNDKVTEKSIIPCVNPSERYPAGNCEIIKRYYSQVGNYTVLELFDIAAECTQKTQMTLASCPVESDFSNSGEMLAVAETCQSYFQSSDLLCLVEYDLSYGYPKSISQLRLKVMDGYSEITIKGFEEN
jgi:hypothetical protein